MKKTFLNTARLLVGILFIFSGLIKANDPLGLSYKMQEFFEVWNMSCLDAYTLGFSVLMIVFEILAGVAVMLGWQDAAFCLAATVADHIFQFPDGICCHFRKDQGMRMFWKLYSASGNGIIYQRPDPACC